MNIITKKQRAWTKSRAVGLITIAFSLILTLSFDTRSSSHYLVHLDADVGQAGVVTFSNLLGSGFNQNREIKITWEKGDGTFPELALFDSDANGSFSRPIMFPANTVTGKHRIQISELGDLQYIPRAETSFYVIRALGDKASAAPGESIQIRGEGFPTGQTHESYIAHQFLELIEQQLDVGSGSFTHDVQIPDGTSPGIYQIDACAISFPIGIDIDRVAGCSSVDIEVIGSQLNPSITLNSYSGPAGSLVAIDGTGYPFTNSAVILWNGTIAPGTALLTDGSGAFSNIEFTIPSNAVSSENPHTISVCAQADGVVTDVCATAEFNITVVSSQPAISLSQYSGPPGISITISGQNFPSNGNGTISWAGVEQAGNSISVDSEGSFSAIPFQIPGNATPRTSPYNVSVCTPLGDSRSCGSASFTVSNGKTIEKPETKPIARARAFSSRVHVGSGDLLLLNTGSYDPDGGAIKEFIWDFGNGEGSVTTRFPFDHALARDAYPNPGSYQATLVVIDDEGERSDPFTINITAYRPNRPIARIGAAPRKGEPPLEVDFMAEFSSDPDGQIVSYFWDFGNNRTSTSVSPSSTYEEYGIYTVTLQVMDNDGFTDQAQIQIEVVDIERAPVAVGKIVSRTGKVPLEVQFDGSSSYDPDPEDDIIFYQWDFGDNSPIVQGSTATHTFREIGTYPVTLTVASNDGDESSLVMNVHVEKRGLFDPPWMLPVAVGVGGGIFDGVERL